jgi:flagellar basal body-associated protein FliL
MPQQPPPSQPFPSPSFPSYYTSNQPATPPQPPKSKARVILIVAAVVMFAVGGVFGGLYVATESDHDKANSVLEDKKTELAGVKKDITSAEDDKSAAEKANSDLQAQNDTLQPCVDATQKFIYDVPSTAPDAEQQAAVQAMRDACK